MSTRKTLLLESLITYLVKRGISDVSLRPMAAAVGTSARLLIFHFGSKERLLLEVLDEMQARLQRSLGELLGEPSLARAAPLRQFWDWAISDVNFAQLRVLYQLHILAAQDHKIYGRYLKRNSRNWLEFVPAVLKPTQRTSVSAVLIAAVFDGLFIEVLSTGDRRRATAAIDEFISMASKHTHARRLVRKHALTRSL